MDEARRTLGVHLTPDSNMSVQIEHMRAQAIAFGSKIHHRSLHDNDVLTVTSTMIMKTLEYLLSTLTLTERYCTYIMAPIIKAILGKLRIFRNIWRDLLYGPSCFQRFGIKNLHVKIGSMQLSRLV